MKLVDIHRHIECSHKPEHIKEVSEQYRTPYTGWDVKDIREQVTLETDGNWENFYEKLVNARKAYVSPGALEELSYHAFMDAAQETDGFEYRFSLMSMTYALMKNLGITQEEIEVMPAGEYSEWASLALDSLLNAKKRAADETTTPFGLRYGFTREPKTRDFETYLKHLGVVANLGVLNSQEFSGLDILGKEDVTYLPEHEEVINYHVRYAIPDLVVHTELRGTQGVRDAMKLTPDAIGHGVDVATDPELMEEVKHEEIFLELCPIVYEKDMRGFIEEHKAKTGEHPLVTIDKSGIKYGIGTDVPGNYATTLKNEYDFVESLGIDVEKVAKNSADRLAAVLDEQKRRNKMRGL